jgi:hypothetical protein
MPELREFSLTGNMVKDLPPSFYSLSNLRALEIGFTAISSLDERIGTLKNLENIHAYDSILEKLPDSIFTLPKLKVLNIDENIFSESEINRILQRLNALGQKGQKIQFSYDKQGHRQMVKRLRGIKNIDSLTADQYAKYCLNAVNENPNAIKYINGKKLGGNIYARLCMAAFKKTHSVLENITPDILGKHNYFIICMEAARANEIGSLFKFIKGEFLEDGQYLQVCIEAALHNKSADFITYFNNDTFKKRFGREIYERICWVAALHNPATAAKK